MQRNELIIALLAADCNVSRLARKLQRPRRWLYRELRRQRIDITALRRPDLAR